MALWKENRRKEVLPLLEKHRRYLLECYRADGKKIDRLDFLLYQLKKRKHGGNNMNDFIFHNPDKVYFGKNQFQHLPEELLKHGKKSPAGVRRGLH